MNKLTKSIVTSTVLALAALRGGADATIDKDLTLDADLDLRESGAVTIPAGVTVDLNGHKLTVKGLSCAGSLVNSESGYQPLEYIQSDGRQWIGTGYLTTDATAIEVDFTPTGDFDNRACFCGDWGGGGHLLVLKTYYNTRQIAFYGPSDDSNVILSNVENRRYRFVTVPGATQTAVLYDGVTGERLAAKSLSLTRAGSGEMTLFAANESGEHPLSCRLHGFRMTDTATGKVERDYVPVRRLSDGEIGLYDRAHDVFCPRHSNSTAPFAAWAYAAQPALASGRLVVDVSGGAAYAVSGRCDARVEVMDGSALSADGDLRCFGRNLEVGGTVSLNGHRLRVASLGGSGAVDNGGGYRYYRLKVDAVRSGAQMQIGEVKLFSGEADVSRQYVDISYPTTSQWVGKGYQPEKALDGDLNTKWFDITSDPGCGPDLLYFDLDYGSPVVITRYQWYTGNDTNDSNINKGRNPKSWRIQGSNDKTNWQDLDVVVDDVNVTTANKSLAYDKVLTYEQDRNDALEVEASDEDASGSYRYYRFKVDEVSSGTQMQIGEFRLFSGDTDVSSQYKAIDYDPNPNFPDYKPEKCFNGQFAMTDKWFDNRSADYMYFILDYGSPVVITRYQWYTGNDTSTNKGRNPKSWRIQGSNDKTTWQDLDVVCGNTSVTTTDATLAYDKVLTAEMTAKVSVRLVDVTSLVKSGEGTVLVPDAALASVANVVIDAGVVKVGRTGFESADGASVVNGSFTVSADAAVSVESALVLGGTLSGGGSLSGAKVRFSGENSCWRMEADDTGFTDKVDASGVTDTTFLAGLKRIEIVYTGENPDGKVLAICPAFSQSDAVNIQLDVKAGALYSIANCWLEVADGLLKIHFAERTPRTAEWTNESGDGNVANPANWSCYDEAGQLISGAVPTNVTTVILGANCRFVCTNAAPLVCGKVRFATDASLAADCDWRGLAGVPFEGTLDLAGHTLTAGLFKGEVTLTGGQTETPGELRIDVPAGVAVTNASVALLGNLRLVKTGAGTLVAARNGQTYTGGTVVREGVLKPGVPDSNYTPFGKEDSVLTVEKGAQYWDDVYAPWATQYIRFQIAGTGPDGTGAIRATHVSNGSINNAEKGWLVALTLTDDAEIARDAYAFSLIANSYQDLPLTLNGHTLTLTSDTLTAIPYLLASSLLGTPDDTGSIVIGDNIQFYPYREKDSDLSNYSLLIATNAIYSTRTDANARNLAVSNLIYRSASGISEQNRLTTVIGCYAPVSTTSAPKVQLGDASHLSTELDLSELTTTFDVAFGGGLTFVEGSVVNVRLGARRPRGAERKLLSWDSQPQGVKFVTRGRKNEGVVAREDGLYLVSGLVITLW